MQNISIILATYNGAAFIASLLDSLTQQTQPIAEIIIADDRSSDNTVEIIQSYTNRLPIKWYVNEKQLGVAANFKKAALLATPGNYLAFCDQDDIWKEDKLFKNIQALSLIDNNQLPALVYSDLKMIDANGEAKTNTFWETLGLNKYKHHYKSLLFGNVVTGCTMMINPVMRKFIAEMPTDVLMHDAWLALVAFNFGKVSAIQEPLVYYRLHKNNVSIKENQIQNDKAVRPSLFTSEKVLKNQYQLIHQFFNQYQYALSKEQQSVFLKFFQMESYPYFFQRLAFKCYFKN